MLEFLQTPTAQAIIWIAVLLMLCAVGAYVVQWFRGQREEGQPSASDMLTRFRKMHDEGALSEAEFRGIKSVLGPRLQEELNSNRAEGED